MHRPVLGLATRPAARRSLAVHLDSRPNTSPESIFYFINKPFDTLLAAARVHDSVWYGVHGSNKPWYSRGL